MSGFERDKTMADKLTYIPNVITQNYPFSRLQIVVGGANCSENRDRTMQDNLKSIPNDDKQNYPFCKSKLLAENYVHC